MLPAITATTRAETAETRLTVEQVLEHYAAELERHGAVVTRPTERRLAFEIPVDRPKTLRLWEADLGLIAGGTLDVEEDPGGVRVRLTARPRGWFLTLALIPWLLLIWALGWTPPPWRFALALGGVPLAASLWVVTWLNLGAFLDGVASRLRTTERPTTI